VSGWAGVTLAQPEPAYEAVALLVIGKAQPHAVGIILAAGEAVVFMQLYEACAVPRSMASSFGFLSSHPKILSRTGIGTVYDVVPSASTKEV